jgi:hypothetical protein
MNIIDDQSQKTRIMDMLYPSLLEVISPSLEPNEFSSWTVYPDSYKFFSVHLELSQDITHTVRTTYKVEDLMRDLGGISVVAFRILSMSTLTFARLRL